MDFKVKCVGYNGSERGFTVGKVYDVVNGVIIRDDGFRYNTWSDPACNPKYENSFKGLTNWFKDWYKFELVTEPKYKIGDRVIATDNCHINREKVGTVVGYWYNMDHPTPYDVKFDNHPCSLWSKIHSLAPTNEKIVITTDGKTTTATLYREDGSKEVATAKCCPEDTFDFNVGAKLAMERLMKKVAPVEEWRVVDREPRVGDYIRLTTDGNYSFSEPGDILKVDAVGYGTVVRVYGRNHPRYTCDPNHLWGYKGDEYEVVEKVTTTEAKKPEPPKYYNGKVVCIDSGNVPEQLTVGKIYNFVDGRCASDRGNQITSGPIKDCEHLNSKFVSSVKFIPIVE